jgi:hypothetical protein
LNIQHGILWPREACDNLPNWEMAPSGTPFRDLCRRDELAYRTPNGVLARRFASAKGHDLRDVKFLRLRDPQFAGWPKRVDPQTGKIELAVFSAQ